MAALQCWPTPALWLLQSWPRRCSLVKNAMMDSNRLLLDWVTDIKMQKNSECTLGGCWLHVYTAGELCEMLHNPLARNVILSHFFPGNHVWTYEKRLWSVFEEPHQSPARNLQEKWPFFDAVVNAVPEKHEGSSFCGSVSWCKFWFDLEDRLSSAGCQGRKLSTC